MWRSPRNALSGSDPRPRQLGWDDVAAGVCCTAAVDRKEPSPFREASPSPLGGPAAECRKLDRQPCVPDGAIRQVG